MPERRLPVRNRGFALLIVLWTMALLSLIIAELTSGSRTELKIAQNLVSNGAAQAAADGAAFEAIFDLLNPEESGRWQPGGGAHLLVVGSSRVRVSLSNEAGRINPNLAPEALLEALMRVTGSDRETARRLASAIEEWVGRNPAPGGEKAAFARYRAAGLDYGPPGQPLETLGELSHVIGMTPRVFAAIRPHLTLYGEAEPDPRAADRVVAAALALAPAANAATPPLGLPAAFPLLLTVRIEAAAQGPGGARATTILIARVGSLLPSGYVVLSRKVRFG